uniref:Uncharacterized protein n=1 Tax=Anguilla anguilla TaxID=7936 RepID=A0A0E9PZK4_ANGAN
MVVYLFSFHAVHRACQLHSIPCQHLLRCGCFLIWFD